MHNQCIINDCWRSVPLPCGQYMAIFDFFERSQIPWLILLNISRPTNSTFFVKARKTSRESSVNQVSVSFLRHSSKQQLHQAKLYQTHTATKLCRFMKLYVSFKTNLLFFVLVICTSPFLQISLPFPPSICCYPVQSLNLSSLDLMKVILGGNLLLHKITFWWGLPIEREITIDRFTHHPPTKMIWHIF